MMPVLKDLFEMLNIQNSAMVMVEARKFVQPLDDFMKNQVIEESDRVWTITRVGYFIGELLVQELGGCWFLNDIPDSRYFLRYVVGKFSSIKNHLAMVDPFEIAEFFIYAAPERSLRKSIDEVINELLKA